MIRLALDYRHRLQRLPLSRAPETHLRPVVPAFVPAMRAGLPRRFLRAGRGWFPVTLCVQVLQNRDVLEGIGARRTLGPYVRFPRSVRPTRQGGQQQHDFQSLRPRFHANGDGQGE